MVQYTVYYTFPVLKLKMDFERHQVKQKFKKSQWLVELGCVVLNNVTYSKTGWSYFEGITDKELLAVCSFFPVSNLHFPLYVFQSFVRYHTREPCLSLY